MTQANRILSFVGMIGCGKTTVGKLLAAEYRLPFVDTDAYLAEHYGMSTAELFDRQGEEQFRRLEAEALRQICESAECAGKVLILSCGGGIVLTQENRALLRQRTYCIWITRPLSAVVQNPRVLHRPPIYDDRERYEVLLRSRIPLYRETSHLQIENRSARHTVHSLARVLQQKGLLFEKA